MEAEARLVAIKDRIRETAEHVAATTSLDEGQAWGDAGLDSLSMVQLRNALQSQLGGALRLSSTTLLDCLSLPQLTYRINAALVPPVYGSSAGVYWAARVEPTAVVGMVCRFPGGCWSLAGLWRFPDGGGQEGGEMPLTWMDLPGWYGPEGEDGSNEYTNQGVCIRGAELFDLKRFGISAAEVMAMDPQQRVGFEVAPKTMERMAVSPGARSRARVGTIVVAGTPDSPHQYSSGGKLSPYVGTESPPAIASDHLVQEFALTSSELQTKNALVSCTKRNRTQPEVYSAIVLIHQENGASFVRSSDKTGPSMTFDTACSSSLVATDGSCKALYTDDCAMAVVVGVNLNLSTMPLACCAASMLSRRGRCTTCSHEADGCARGEGCRAVLEPLSNAVEHDDAVWVVLHGSAVNQDGGAASLTGPNGPAQEQVESPDCVGCFLRSIVNGRPTASILRGDSNAVMPNVYELYDNSWADGKTCDADWCSALCQCGISRCVAWHATGWYAGLEACHECPTGSIQHVTGLSVTSVKVHSGQAACRDGYSITFSSCRCDFAAELGDHWNCEPSSPARLKRDMTGASAGQHCFISVMPLAWGSVAHCVEQPALPCAARCKAAEAFAVARLLISPVYFDVDHSVIVKCDHDRASSACQTVAGDLDNAAEHDTTLPIPNAYDSNVRLFDGQDLRIFACSHVVFVQRDWQGCDRTSLALINAGSDEHWTQFWASGMGRLSLVSCGSAIEVAAREQTVAFVRDLFEELLQRCDIFSASCIARANSSAGGLPHGIHLVRVTGEPHRLYEASVDDGAVRQLASISVVTNQALPLAIAPDDGWLIVQDATGLIVYNPRSMQAEHTTAIAGSPQAPQLHWFSNDAKFDARMCYTRLDIPLDMSTQQALWITYSAYQNSAARNVQELWPVEHTKSGHAVEVVFFSATKRHHEGLEWSDASGYLFAIADVFSNGLSQASVPARTLFGSSSSIPYQLASINSPLCIEGRRGDVPLATSDLHVRLLRALLTTCPSCDSSPGSTALTLAARLAAFSSAPLEMSAVPATTPIASARSCGLTQIAFLRCAIRTVMMHETLLSPTDSASYNAATSLPVQGTAALTPRNADPTTAQVPNVYSPALPSTNVYCKQTRSTHADEVGKQVIDTSSWKSVQCSWHLAGSTSGRIVEDEEDNGIDRDELLHAADTHVATAAIFFLSLVFIWKKAKAKSELEGNIVHASTAISVRVLLGCALCCLAPTGGEASDHGSTALSALSKPTGISFAPQVDSMSTVDESGEPGCLGWQLSRSELQQEISHCDLGDPLSCCIVENTDTSGVTDMSYMFYASGFNGNISGWNVSAVTDMSGMFASSSFNGDIANWDVSDVADMSYMFASSSFNGGIGDWDVSAVTGMSGMFFASSFNGDLANWNVSAVTDMSGMFAFSSFNAGIANWDVSAVTAMFLMFEGSSFNRGIANWDVSAVTDMSGMFAASSFNGDIAKWDVSAVTGMSGMFEGSSFNGDIAKWDVSDVTDMSRMFASSSFNGGIGDWDVSAVTDMSLLFSSSSFNGDIANWKVSATDMSGMFASSSFNGDIANWDVSAVRAMTNMFEGSPFNGDIANWDVSAVTDMSRMFASSSFNGDIANWDVSAVTDMSRMFASSSFNGGIANWDVSAVTDMSLLFASSSFNGGIGDWDVSAVTDMSRMFASSSFNGGIANWDVSAVTDMSYMFASSSFNGDISGWNIMSVADMRGMFGSSIFMRDLCTWNLAERGNIATSCMFCGSWPSSAYLSPYGCQSSAKQKLISLIIGCQNAEWDETSAACIAVGSADTREVRDMSFLFYESSFNGDLSRWNVALVTGMSHMFYNSSFNGDISGWDVSSARGMAWMFASSPFNRNIANWDVSAVDDMSGMFYESSFKCDISRWDVSSVTEMHSIFDGADALPGPAGWLVTKSALGYLIEGCERGIAAACSAVELADTSLIMDMSFMFIGSSFNGNIANWNVSAVNDMSGMFYESSFNRDISRWDVSSVTNMITMFFQSSFNGNISGWDVSSVESMYNMFSSSSFNGDIANWDVSAVHDMSGMFLRSSFNRDIAKWDVSAVTDMGLMFASSSFNGNIANWDVSAVTSMSGMFEGSSFNGDIANWDVSAVINTRFMFYQSSFDVDISKWPISSIDVQQQITLQRDWPACAITQVPQGLCDHYFCSLQLKCLVVECTANAPLFLDPVCESITKWNTSKVGQMSALFENVDNFNADLSSWDTSSVLYMDKLFSGASAFNGDISRWNTSAVKNMSRMFRAVTSDTSMSSCCKFSAECETTSKTGCTRQCAYHAFNGDISRWDTGAVTDMSDMLACHASFNGDLSPWDTSSVTNIRNMFAGANSFNQDISVWNTWAVTDMNGLFRACAPDGSDCCWEYDCRQGKDCTSACVESVFNWNVHEWDISSVLDMGQMFFYASSFNHDLCLWKLGGVENVFQAFTGNQNKQHFCDCTAQPGRYCVQGLTNSSGTICPAGRYCSGGRSQPRICSDDRAKPGRYCPAGTSSAAGSLCPTGSFCSGGSLAPRSCAQGFFQDKTGSMDCVPCPVGTSSSEIGAAKNTTCLPCTPGAFVNVPGSARCHPCAAGTHQSESGARSCEPCKAGAYCPEGSASPLVCPPGTFSNATNLEARSACTDCPAGHACTAGSTEPSPCLPGSYAENRASDSCALCAAGFFNSQQAQHNCTKCKAGSLCPPGASQELPAACDPGKYTNESDTDGEPDCFACPSGFWCPGGAARPRACSAGSFENETGSSECRECEAGSYQSERGEIKCKPCPSGSYCIEGATAPLPCPAGRSTKHNLGGMTSADDCVPCPVGTFCPTGSTSATECAPGTFNNVTEVHICAKCPAGKYQDENRATSCKACEAGSYCVEGASAPLPCPAGHRVDWSRKVMMSAEDCVVCRVGTFCPTGSQNATSCPPGSFGAQNASSACMVCSPGSYSKVGATACTNCETGKYADNFGQGFCIPCPYPLSNARRGSVLCSVCREGFFLNDSAVSPKVIFTSPDTYCTKCPPKVQCGPNTSLETLPIPFGSWRDGAASSRIYHCFVSSDYSPCSGTSRRSDSDLGSSGSYCIAGHRGPLCKVCVEHGKFYDENSGRCLECSKTSKLGRFFGVLMAAAALLVLAFIAAKKVASFRRIVNRAATVAANVSLLAKLKVLISFYQVFNTLGDVYGVRLHRHFTGWLDILSVFDAPAAEFMLPGTCMGSVPARLTLNSLWPVAVIAVVVAFIGAMGLVQSTYFKKKRRTGAWVTRNRAGNATVFILFLVLPNVSRSIFAAKQCVSFDSNDTLQQRSSYLLADLRVSCSSDEFRNLNTIFWVFFVLWPMMVPLMGLVLVLAISGSVRAQRFSNLANACRFLWRDYQPSFLYWEMVDMMRKILLTAMILFVDTEFGDDRLLRLWLAAFVSGGYVVLLALARPFKLAEDLHLACTSNFMLTMCFLSGIVIKLCEDQAWTDSCQEFLGLSGSFQVNVFVVAITVVMLVLCLSIIVLKTVMTLRSGTIRVIATGRDPVLELPSGCGYHCFMSHAWRTGQDQTHTVVRQLQLLLSEMQVWLDVDNLNDVGKLEEAVDDCAVFTVFLSRGYFRSVNCRRELYAALAKKKPIVTVREAERDKGGATVQELKRECMESCGEHAQQVIECLFDQEPVVWVRVRDFQIESLKLIAFRVLEHLPYYQRNTKELEKGLKVAGELGSCALLWPLVVLVCNENTGAQRVAEELQLAGRGAAVRGQSPAISVRSADLVLNEPPEDESKTVLLLYLNNQTFLDAGNSVSKLVQESMERKILIVPVHEQDAEAGSCTFGEIYDRTPEELLSPPYKLWDTLAIPLFPAAEHRKISLLHILCRLGAKRVRNTVKRSDVHQAVHAETRHSTAGTRQVSTNKQLQPLSQSSDLQASATIGTSHNSVLVPTIHSAITPNWVGTHTSQPLDGASTSELTFPLAREEDSAASNVRNQVDQVIPV